MTWTVRDEPTTTFESREKIRLLFAKGDTVAQISKRYGLGTSVVRRAILCKGSYAGDLKRGATNAVAPHWRLRRRKKTRAGPVWLLNWHGTEAVLTDDKDKALQFTEQRAKEVAKQLEDEWVVEHSHNARR